MSAIPMPSVPMSSPVFAYRAPWWLPGGHLQTIWTSLFSRTHDGTPPDFRRERWTTPDDDFVDVDFLVEPPGADRSRPMLVLFHGLEGSSTSGYAQAFACLARELGYAYAVPHFRGCSGELNLAPRAYHSGDHEEVDWILERLRTRRGGPVLAVGISLGGNMLLRWAEEHGTQAARKATAIAAVCSPLDLAAGGRAIGRGFGRHSYTRMFLGTMKPKALAKLRQHPGLFDGDRLRAARDLYEFDNAFTAPVHGFRDTEDYWSRASSKPRLADIRIPALVLNARNDPFVPADSLPTQAEVGRHVTLWQPREGGHVGFAHGALPRGMATAMPQAVFGWLRDNGR
ncbi:MAG TPA: alpha/beta fold hydrolase [Burkholderiaceae bacterium]